MHFSQVRALKLYATQEKVIIAGQDMHAYDFTPRTMV